MKNWFRRQDKGEGVAHDLYVAAVAQARQPLFYVEYGVPDTVDGRFDLIILPGGYSHGDYLRAGAIAQFSTVMKEVVRFARSGGMVLGICNGFQILCESGLLPGILMRNDHLQFRCEWTNLRIESSTSPFTSSNSSDAESEQDNVVKAVTVSKVKYCFLIIGLVFISFG
mgnify:CR=1 FL=1